MGKLKDRHQESCTKQGNANLYTIEAFIRIQKERVASSVALRETGTLLGDNVNPRRTFPREMSRAYTFAYILSVFSIGLNYMEAQPQRHLGVSYIESRPRVEGRR